MIRRVSVRVRPERAEEARAVMLELFPEGFEEVEGDDGVELAAYTGAGGEERVWQVFGPGRAEPVPTGWTDAWKRFHRPIRIGPLWVGPPWERPDDDAVAVVVDPGQAFGTGSHPTTRLCLELLVERAPSSLVDLGCGSGVVAIAAAKLGFSPVVAVDFDERAVETAAANASVNGVAIDVRRADVVREPVPEADLAVANISIAGANELLPRLESRVAIVSGYLAPERPRAPDWRHVERREADGWAADILERS